MSDFANTYAAIDWQRYADCHTCGKPAQACSWLIDRCCAKCDHCRHDWWDAVDGPDWCVKCGATR